MPFHLMDDFLRWRIEGGLDQSELLLAEISKRQDLSEQFGVTRADFKKSLGFVSRSQWARFRLWKLAVLGNELTIVSVTPKVITLLDTSDELDAVAQVTALAEEKKKHTERLNEIQPLVKLLQRSEDDIGLHYIDSFMLASLVGAKLTLTQTYIQLRNNRPVRDDYCWLFTRPLNRRMKAFLGHCSDQPEILCEKYHYRQVTIGREVIPLAGRYQVSIRRDDEWPRVDPSTNLDSKRFSPVAADA